MTTPVTQLNASAGMTGVYPRRANWKDQSLLKLFIELCIDSISKHGHVFGRWDDIGKIILEKKGFTYKEEQLKSKFSILHKKYEVWSILVASATAYGSNPTASHRNWSSERWDDYIKKNPNAQQFRYRGLDCEEEMTKLFGKIIPANRFQWGTSKEGSPPGSGGEASSSQAGKESSHMNNDSCAPQSSSNDASLPKDKSGKKRSPNESNDQVERVLKTLKKSDGPTIEECNQVLDAMRLLEMDSTLYVAACGIFCESQAHREQWMMLSKKSEEARISWILMIAKRLGLL